MESLIVFESSNNPRTKKKKTGQERLHISTVTAHMEWESEFKSMQQ